MFPINPALVNFCMWKFRVFHGFLKPTKACQTRFGSVFAAYQTTPQKICPLYPYVLGYIKSYIPVIQAHL